MLGSSLAKRTVFCLVIIALNGATIAKGAYLLTPSIAGQSQATVLPGQSFTIDLTLSGLSSDQHDACEFLVSFTAPGLVMTSYTWGSPYSMQFDLSTPDDAQLPVMLTPELLQGGVHPDGIVDISFSNLTDSGLYGSGLLLSVGLMVPTDWTGPEAFQVQVIPDQFTRGFVGVPVSSSGLLTVTVPAPFTPAVAVVVAGCALQRRRRVV